MAQQTRPVAVLVDAYSTGNYLPPAFDRLGVDVVHVQSTPELMAKMFQPDLTAYLANIVATDPGVAAAELATYNPIAVVAGQEPGVPLADALSERLGLATNGTKLSAARRDKYEMTEALRRAGVRCAEQFKSSSADEIVAWVRQYPVVVKPLSSSGTVDVRVCDNAEQVREAAEAVLSSASMYDEANREALVQSYLDGPEYVVDMVSCQGRRYLCGVWEYRKRLLCSHNLYDREVVLPSDESPVPELIAYVDTALDALGIQFGPTHAEVIITPDGPALVEVGARLGGNMHPGLHDECLGGNQADLTALAYARPQEFLDRYADRRYTKIREASVCCTPTPDTGIVRVINQDVVAQIEDLETVFLVNLKIKPGDRIYPTLDLSSATMKVFMAGDSEDALLRDYKRIQDLKDKIYQLY